MMNTLSINSNLDEKQQSILNSNGNIIVDGCAGSGKTLLAVKVAKKYAINPTSNILIIVYTSSLVSFIKNNIEEKNVTVRTFASVINILKKDTRLPNNYDVVIIDEAQDFESSELNSLKQYFNCITYIFIDFKQQAYSNFKDTVKSIEDLKKTYSFDVIKLTKSYRISNANANFISSIYDNTNLNTESEFLKAKPLIKKFSSINDELDYLIKYCQENRTEEIGVLFHENLKEKSVEYSYMMNLIPRTIILPNIVELVDKMKSNNIEAGFKFQLYNNSNFSKNKNINLMTIHSSKGIEFDTVILPFSNESVIGYSDYLKSLYYIAMTRSINKIIITYTDVLCNFYSNAKIDTFEGEMRFLNLNKDIRLAGK